MRSVLDLKHAPSVIQIDHSLKMITACAKQLTNGTSLTNQFGALANADLTLSMLKANAWVVTRSSQVAPNV